MEKVIVAFENETSGRRICSILENADVATGIYCHSFGEVKRLTGKQRIPIVICGYKLADGPAEMLFDDLPVTCSMLLIAQQSQLDLCENEDIFRLPAPVSKGDLAASVRMLMQMSKRLERFVRPRRCEEENKIIEQAKQVLMSRHGMSEEQAHRLIQKQSMDTGAKMVQTARLILDDL